MQAEDILFYIQASLACEGDANGTSTARASRLQILLNLN